MQIGVDASGKFEMKGGFAPSVVAASVVPDAASEELKSWTASALRRWGRDSELDELHANELTVPQRLETCEMLAARDDIRLAAVLSDQLLLRSRDAVAKHRERQLAFLRALPQPTTEAGRSRLAEVDSMLQGRRLPDHEYVFAASIPPLLVTILNQAFGRFRDGEWAEEMAAIRLLIDEDTPTLVRYLAATLLPTIGGDDRFRLTVPIEWHGDRVHPLYAKAVHPDGDGLRPQACTGEMEWVASSEHIPIQLADIGAWVIRRVASEPTDTSARECFKLLTPLLAGRDGELFQLFAIGPKNPDAEAIYEHLRWDAEPEWWLRPVASPLPTTKA